MKQYNEDKALIDCSWKQLSGQILEADLKRICLQFLGREDDVRRSAISGKKVRRLF